MGDDQQAGDAINGTENVCETTLTLGPGTWGPGSGSCLLRGGGIDQDGDGEVKLVRTWPDGRTQTHHRQSRGTVTVSWGQAPHSSPTRSSSVSAIRIHAPRHSETRRPRARRRAFRTRTGSQRLRASKAEGGGADSGGDGDGEPAAAGRSTTFARDFVSVAAAAELLLVNYKTLYAAIAAGTIAGVLRLGRVIRVAPSLALGGRPPLTEPGDPSDLLFTAEELAQYFDVDVKSIYGAAQRQEIPANRVGNALRFSRARLLRSCTTGQGRGSPKRSRK